MVRDALLPIWLDKPETARRVLQRITDVLTWAVAKQYRHDMPLLSAKALRMPKQAKGHAHHAAMPYAEVPAFLSLLREREGMSRLALEFAILTAARSGEVRGATWDEIDLEAALWTVPGSRMKAGRAHVVPLSPAALDCLRRAQALRTAPKPGKPDLLFPSPMTGGAMSDMALTKLLRDLGVGVTAHGFRSSFRDWASEETAFPGEVAEMALAHSIADKTEAAYRRGDLLAKRRGLMDAWGRFVTGESGAVVQLRNRK
jgi:integrase